MSTKYNILIFGASYGSLFAAKLLLADHSVQLVCLPDEAKLINDAGIRVRLPVRGLSDLVEVDSRNLNGQLSACEPSKATVKEADLVILAMQEPQYGAHDVRALLDDVALAGVPCMSIMNMPPLAYMRRIPGIDSKLLEECYTDPGVWGNFDPANITLCSPDPQAFRPPDEKPNVLQVSLPTNFKAAAFEVEKHTAILRDIQADIEAITFDAGSESVNLPVKLKVHDSLYVPLAKWSMLLTGNYRCIQESDMQSIRDAVHTDIDASRAVYDWVCDLCVSIGASRDDLVPFDKYAAAAAGLAKPSSAARALLAGRPNIERVDRLIRDIARQKGRRSPVLDYTVGLVDAWLKRNRNHNGRVQRHN